jgi:hypothetical protein
LCFTEPLDPRLFLGALSSNAVNATPPVRLTINDTTVIKARIFDAGKSAWGVLDSVTLTVAPPNKGIGIVDLFSFSYLHFMLLIFFFFFIFVISYLFSSFSEAVAFAATSS